jgi:hypothetical protein
VGVLESRPRGVDAEAAEDEHDQELLDPPRVRSERRARDHLAALIAEKRFPHLTRSPSRMPSSLELQLVDQLPHRRRRLVERRLLLAVSLISMICSTPARPSFAGTPT